MKWLFSIGFVFKLSICIVALSSLNSNLRFSPVTPYHRRSFLKCTLDYKMPKYERAISLLVPRLFVANEQPRRAVRDCSRDRKNLEAK